MKKYTKPEVEIVNFETADVLMTSGDYTLEDFVLKTDGNQAERFNDAWNR